MRRVGHTTLGIVLAVAVGPLSGHAVGATKPTVESVAAKAVAQLGPDAPRAVLFALSEGADLATIVRAVRAGELAQFAPDDGITYVGDHAIIPTTTHVVVGERRIISNVGARSHSVRVVGADLPEFVLEPDTVGVYELGTIAPGTYTIETFGPGPHLTAKLAVRATTSGFRGPVGGRSAPAQAADVPSATDTPTHADLVEMLDVINEGVVGLLSGSSVLAPSSTTKAVADPAVLVRKALKTKDKTKIAAAMITQGIVLGAQNGYTAEQMTAEILIPLLLHGKEGLAAAGPSNLFASFFWGGVMPGVDPEGDPSRSILADGPKVGPEQPTTSDEPAEEEPASTDGKAVTYVVTLVADRCIDGTLHGTRRGRTFSLNVGEGTGSGNTLDWPVKKNGSFDFRSQDADGEGIHITGRVTDQSITGTIVETFSEGDVCTISMTGTREG